MLCSIFTLLWQLFVLGFCCSGVGLGLRLFLPNEFSLLSKALFSLTGGLFLGQEATVALTHSSGRSWASQDQRNTVSSRFRYQVSRRVSVALGGNYGSGLPVAFDGTEQQALAQYGQQVVNRVDLLRGRVRPWLSIDASAGFDLWKKDDLAVRLRADVRNLNNRLNLIDFAGLFSGNAISPPRSVAARLSFDY